MKTYSEVLKSNSIFDASGIDNPNKWLWDNNSVLTGNVYYPVIEMRLKTALPETIQSIEDAKKLLTDLHNNGEAFHPEDDAKDCLVNITDEEGEQLNRLMNEIYLLKGNEHYQNMIFDPCQFILELDPDYINNENFLYRYGKELIAAKTQSELDTVNAKFKAIAKELNFKP